VTLKDYRVVIAIKLGGKERTFSLFSFLNRKEEQEERRRLEELFRKARDLRGEFQSILSGTGFSSVVPMDALNLSRFLYRVINYPEEPEFTEVENISRSVVSYETVVEVAKDHIRLGKLYGCNLFSLPGMKSS